MDVICVAVVASLNIPHEVAAFAVGIAAVTAESVVAGVSGGVCVV